jgi:RNA polymerase-binding protein DksA
MLEPTHVRQLLDDELARRRREREALAGDLVEESSDRSEMAAPDQHPADQATDVEDASLALGLRADMDRLIDETEAALGRLDQGRYGICERCGRPIPDDRLEAVPSTRYCVEDQVAARAGR